MLLAIILAIISFTLATVVWLSILVKKRPKSILLLLLGIDSGIIQIAYSILIIPSAFAVINMLMQSISVESTSLLYAFVLVILIFILYIELWVALYMGYYDYNTTVYTTYSKSVLEYLEAIIMHIAPILMFYFKAGISRYFSSIILTIGFGIIIFLKIKLLASSLLYTSFSLRSYKLCLLLLLSIYGMIKAFGNPITRLYL